MAKKIKSTKSSKNEFAFDPADLVTAGSKKSKVKLDTGSGKKAKKVKPAASDDDDDDGEWEDEADQKPTKPAGKKPKVEAKPTKPAGKKPKVEAKPTKPAGKKPKVEANDGGEFNIPYVGEGEFKGRFKGPKGFTFDKDPGWGFVATNADEDRQLRVSVYPVTETKSSVLFIGWIEDKPFKVLSQSLVADDKVQDLIVAQLEKWFR